jgi:hypothetical protein
MCRRGLLPATAVRQAKEMCGLCVAVLAPVRCSLLLLVRPAEEMYGEEAAPPTGCRREVSDEEDATGGEMCLRRESNGERVEW